MKRIITTALSATLCLCSYAQMSIDQILNLKPASSVTAEDIAYYNVYKNTNRGEEARIKKVEKYHEDINDVLDRIDLSILAGNKEMEALMQSATTTTSDKDDIDEALASLQKGGTGAAEALTRMSSAIISDDDDTSEKEEEEDSLEMQQLVNSINFTAGTSTIADNDAKEQEEQKLLGQIIHLNDSLSELNSLYGIHMLDLNAEWTNKDAHEAMSLLHQIEDLDASGNEDIIPQIDVLQKKILDLKYKHEVKCVKQKMQERKQMAEVYRELAKLSDKSSAKSVRSTATTNAFACFVYTYALP